jgi:hypothetical protein
VEWTMRRPSPADARWRQDIQGIITSDVIDSGRAFERVEPAVFADQMREVTRIWMDGPDLPVPTGWQEAVRRKVPGRLRLRVVVNDSPIFGRLQSYMVPLVLLAWLNSRNRHEHDSEVVETRCTSATVLEWIDGFLGRRDALGSRRTTQPNVNGILNDAVEHICRAGGLATFRDVRGRPTVFTLYARPFPSFLPIFRA